MSRFGQVEMSQSRQPEVWGLENCDANRSLIHRCIDVYQYPDGRIEIRADGQSLRYERYDRLGQIDASAIVEKQVIESRAEGCGRPASGARQPAKVEHALAHKPGPSAPPQASLERYQAGFAVHLRRPRAGSPCDLCRADNLTSQQVTSAHLRDDLTTVGVRVACATPPVDKSRPS